MAPNVQGETESLGERVIALVVALAGFTYLLIRLVQSWLEWPEDGLTAGLRIGELCLIGVFILWLATQMVRTKPPATQDAKFEPRGSETCDPQTSQIQE